jgi:vesicle transport through interaction with t-SNAREs protein 1
VFYISRTSTIKMDYYDEEANRRRVLEGRVILERTSDSLARSHQVALETEQIGTEVCF